MKFLLVLLPILITACSKHTYYVGTDKCQHIYVSSGKVVIDECVSGLTYVNPPTYREVKEY